MAYLFLDDGSPEAAAYDSNYLWFDPHCPEDVERLARLAEEGGFVIERPLWGLHENATVRALLRNDWAPAPATPRRAG
jgi:hypothetical protein